MIRLDLDTGLYYRGFGDCVACCWLPDVEIYTKHVDKQIICQILNTPYTEDIAGAVNASPAQQKEFADNEEKPRLEYVREMFGFGELRRPEISIPVDSEDWANEEAARYQKPMVLIFPQTHWSCRGIPVNTMIDLAWQLNSAGLRPVIVTPNKDPKFNNVPHKMYGLNLFQVAALMKIALLVIGPDSFPVWFSSTLGTKTLAIMGPTKPNIFPAPEIQCLRNLSMECTGCVFARDKGFRAGCDQGCFSIMGISAETIVNRSISLIYA